MLPLQVAVEELVVWGQQVLQDRPVLLVRLVLQASRELRERLGPQALELLELPEPLVLTVLQDSREPRGKLAQLGFKGQPEKWELRD
jgi:hypothetical protein